MASQLQTLHQGILATTGSASPIRSGSGRGCYRRGARDAIRFPMRPARSPADQPR
jgi:hypothetical protein